MTSHFPLNLYSFAASPGQIAVGDLNGDGKADLVVADEEEIPYVFLSNGDGTLTAEPQMNVSCDNGCRSVVVADLNGDGKLDFATANAGEQGLPGQGGSISIFFGDGTGKFTPGPVTSPNTNYFSLGMGDFNGDKNVDLVYGQGGYVFTGVSFGPEFTSGALVDNSASLFLPGDFNNDGVTDLIVGEPDYGVPYGAILSENLASATIGDISIDSGAPGFHQVVATYEGNSTHQPSSSTVPLPGPGASIVALPPVFSPPAGTYNTSQLIAITDATPDTTIYYTTDGSAPTILSNRYYGPIPMPASSSFTIAAIAAVANYWPSPVAAETYNQPGAFALNSANSETQGFGPPAIQCNGSCFINPGDPADGYFPPDPIVLTNSSTSNSAGSAFYTTSLNIQSFTTDFTFQIGGISSTTGQPTGQAGDGFTFTIQNTGPTALGSPGGSLGYRHIGKSVAIKFDLYDNGGEGTNSTGLYLNGAYPTVPAVDLTGTGIDLHSGHMMDAHITYGGATLNLTITDLVTLATWSHPFAVDIPGTVGGDTAYVGFTGGTGSSTAEQQILAWSYQAGTPPYFGSGFDSQSSLARNGHAAFLGNTLKLTDGGHNEASSAYYRFPVNVRSFNTDFDFELSEASADGFTFTIQNAGLTALGSPGGGLGYQHIPNSVAIKFDLFDNGGEGSNSTGIYTGGDSTFLPAVDLTGTGINLHSGDKMHAHLAYDGTTLTLTLTDLVTTATWSHPFPIDIPATVGGDTAYAGFTAGTGSLTAIQQILNWTFQ